VDCDEDFATVCAAARRAGVQNPICRAASGDECLRMLRSATQQAQWTFPAFVLLDLNTSQGDHRDVLRKIKQNERLRAMPLVVLSTSGNPRDLTCCYDSGANAYHVKPVMRTAHLQVLEKIFGYWLGGAALPTLPIQAP
jgi:CheY-like chemotaxis protein